MANCIRDDADYLDPPQPEVPEGFVWFRLASSDMLLQGVYESGRVVDADAEIHPVERLAEIIPARTVEPGQVAVDKCDLENVLIILEGVQRPGRELSADRLREALDSDKEARR